MLLPVITLPAPLPTVDALDMPFEAGWFVMTEGRWGAISGVYCDLGGCCGRKCCCWATGPKFGETDVPL